MEMGEILAARRPDGRDFLAAVHVVASVDQYFLTMAIIGLYVTACAVPFDRVQNNDDVAPAGSTVACQQNAAIRHGVNGISEIGIFTADTIKIISEMMVSRETLSVIREGAVLAAKGEIKARRQRKRREFKWRRNLKSWVKMGGASDLGPKFPGQSPEDSEHKHHYEKQDLSHLWFG